MTAPVAGRAPPAPAGAAGPATDGADRHPGGQTRVDLIKPALQACAGNLYTQANDTTSLNNAFTGILQTYVGVRLIN